ncbi:MAG: phosphotransferase [Syntrophomonas sp.]
MIPEAKQIAVKHALQATFGVNEYEEIRELTAGLTSALVFRIVVQGNPYLLRIITRTDTMSDPTQQFACMKVAAEAGLAPRIWYMSIEDRITITDFVEIQPFPVGEAKIKLPDLLRNLHSLPPFPKLMNYFETVDSFIRKFQDAKILPEKMTEELFQGFARIVSAYPQQGQDLVSCHNDLKPENILFDGVHPWLVDWEAASLNDRYADLAVVANFVVSNDHDKSRLLGQIFWRSRE